jgi:hypothetical protein
MLKKGWMPHYNPLSITDTAPLFCGHNSIDTQNPPSYTPATKKEVLVNQCHFE